jgi:hypothetical protein
LACRCCREPSCPLGSPSAAANRRCGCPTMPGANGNRGGKFGFRCP